MVLHSEAELVGVDGSPDSKHVRSDDDLQRVRVAGHPNRVQPLSLRSRHLLRLLHGGPQRALRWKIWHWTCRRESERQRHGQSQESNKEVGPKMQQLHELSATQSSDVGRSERDPD